MDAVQRKELAKKLDLFYSETYDRFKAGEKTFKTDIEFKVGLLEGLQVPEHQTDSRTIKLEDLSNSDVSKYVIGYWGIDNPILDILVRQLPLHVALKGEMCKIEFVMDNDTTKALTFEGKLDDDDFKKDGDIWKAVMKIIKEAKLLIEDPHTMSVTVTNIDKKGERRKEFEKEIMIDPKKLMSDWFGSKKDEDSYRHNYSSECIKNMVECLRTKDARVAMINLLWKVHIPKSRTNDETRRIFDDLPNTTFGIVNIDDGYLLIKAVENNDLDGVRRVLGRTGYLGKSGELTNQEVL
jgi:hypothetical protein